MIAGAYALRCEGLPPFILWDKLKGSSIYLDFCEDNEAMIKICKSGMSQKLKHVSRTHRINIGWVAERFRDDPFILVLPTKSQDQAADIYILSA